MRSPLAADRSRVFERPSYVTRWRWIGWAGADSNLRIPELKFANTPAWGQDFNLRHLELCSPPRYPNTTVMAFDDAKTWSRKRQGWRKSSNPRRAVSCSVNTILSDCTADSGCR